jgi:hypothetical protein
MRLDHAFAAPLLLFLFVLASPARADWINLTGAETAPNIAEIYVMDDHVKVVLEIYIGDLKAFEELVPDDWLKDADVQRSPLAERLRRFSDKTFQVVTGAGEKLQARVEVVEPRMRKDRKSPFAGMINPYTRQRVPESPQDKRVLYAELIYPFEGRPARFTFVPPLDEEGRATVTLGFIAYHKVVPVIDFRYLGAPAHLNPDWEDPWYSRFDNPNLKRHHSSALMSFLYVEPYEVRHEILTRVKDLEEWKDLGLSGDEYIEVDELEPLKRRIGELMLGKNPVRVDGKPLKPILDRTNYVKVGLGGLQLMEKPQRLEISTAIVGVIITYITDGLPQQVTVDWELFTDQVKKVPATATDPAGPLMTYVTPEESLHTWNNYLKNYQLPTVEEVAVEGTFGDLDLPLGTFLGVVLLLPVGLLAINRRRTGKPVVVFAALAVLLSVGALASYPYFRVPVVKPAALAGALNDDQAKLLLQTLLKNVYRAFDFREEEDVYDKLAFSVSGDLLADIYLQNRKSFAIQKAGGAQAKIKQVDILEASAERLDDGALGYSIKGRWTALGSVGHWGHVHMRRNLYDAIVRIEAVDGSWKITDLELLEEKRIDPNARTSGQASPERRPSSQ